MSNPTKAEVRRAVRALFPGGEIRARESAALCAHLLASPEYAAADTVAAYVPLRREADVTAVLSAVLRDGKVLALPLVEGEGLMTLRRMDTLDALIPGAYGIPEPPQNAPVIAPDALDLLIVPLEAIDRSGLRLGKGGGFYDRLLPQTHCPAIGAVMSWQWIDRTPRDPWDKPLDAAADCAGVHRFNKGRND